MYDNLRDSMIVILTKNRFLEQKQPPEVFYEKMCS